MQVTPQLLAEIQTIEWIVNVGMVVFCIWYFWLWQKTVEQEAWWVTIGFWSGPVVGIAMTEDPSLALQPWFKFGLMVIVLVWNTAAFFAMWIQIRRARRGMRAATRTLYDLDRASEE